MFYSYKLSIREITLDIIILIWDRDHSKLKTPPAKAKKNASLPSQRLIRKLIQTSKKVYFLYSVHKKTEPVEPWEQLQKVLEFKIVMIMGHNHKACLPLKQDSFLSLCDLYIKKKYDRKICATLSTLLPLRTQILDKGKLVVQLMKRKNYEFKAHF